MADQAELMNEFGNFDGYLPNEEIEYIYYDQLDSYYSDKPNDSTLWTTEHFVEEVEQVRKGVKPQIKTIFTCSANLGVVFWLWNMP